jgi:hypothetical protein
MAIVLTVAMTVLVAVVVLSIALALAWVGSDASTRWHTDGPGPGS